MKDIRKPYHNLSINNTRNQKLKEVEDFERDNYQDIEYDKKGSPVMKAGNHFAMDGVSKRQKDNFDVLKRENYFSLTKKSQSHQPTSKKFNPTPTPPKGKWKFIFSILLILIVALGFYLWTNVYNSSLVTVSPKSKSLEINQTFDLNLSDLLIASSTIISQKTIAKSLPKEINSKASGEIIIYNNYSTSPQKLLKNTRFQTKDGKIFRITDSVIVPGKVGETPKSIKAKVYADTYGANYNIPASDFNIPGFKGSDKYNLFYAKSVTKMSGGASGKVTVVAVEDITAAKNDLTNQNTQKLSADIKNMNYAGYIGFLDSPVISQIDNANDLLKINNNNYILTSQAKVVFIKNFLLAGLLAKSVMGDTVNQNLSFRIDDYSKLKFTLAKNTDLTSSATATVLISGKAKIIWDYNPETIKAILAGQKTADFTNLLKNYIDIFSKQSFTVTPSWSGTFPKDIQKIEIKEILN